MEFDTIIQLVILFMSGAIGGVLAGLLGVGGGVIYIVVLSYYLQQYQINDIEIVKYMVSNSALAIFFASIAGSIKQYKSGNFYPKEVALTAIPAIFTALIASYFIIRFQWYSKEKFTIVFIVFLSLFLFKLLGKTKATGINQIEYWKYTMVGQLTGIFAAFSGLGGGIIMVPILNGIFKLNIKKVTSISLGVMPFFTLTMAILYAIQNKPADAAIVPGSIGFLIPHFVIPISIGVIIGSPIGVIISHKLSDKLIKVIFAALLILVIIRMIYSTL